MGSQSCFWSWWPASLLELAGDAVIPRRIARPKLPDDGVMNSLASCPADPQAPVSAMVVVGRAGAASESTALDESLLHALPDSARVLEIRAASDVLQKAYCQAHHACEWTTVSMFNDSGSSPVWPDPASRYDLIVVADVLPWLADPVGLLTRLARHVVPGGRLVLSIDNHANPDLLARCLDGDLSVDVRRAPGGQQPRLVSPPVIYKWLMDAGWMPTLASHVPAASPARPVQAALTTLAQALGRSSEGSGARVQQMERLVIDARPTFANALSLDAPALFDVLVPTTDEHQLRTHVECAPGLREVGARIVSYRGASSAAEALERGRQHAKADWILLCHQDVYFPAGFGHQLNACLEAIPPEQRATSLLGFVGMGSGPGGHGRSPAGFVIDRLTRFDHPASEAAVSIDELALVVARETVHRIDPALGWHLWATDLCLNAVCTHRVLPRIVRLPVFHNSRTGWKLPQEFHVSAGKLAKKWSGFGPIHTLCGVIEASQEQHEERQPA